jgi:hypothetical protein
VQDAAPPRDAIGIVLIADARLLPHCSYAVRRPPRTSWLWGAAPLSHHIKSLNGGPEFAERGLTSCRADLVNAGVPNAATYSRTSEKPSARTAFRHGERAPDCAQPLNTRKTKCPDIRKNQRLLSVFSYPMLVGGTGFSGFSDSAALRKSRTRMGCGPRRECALGEIRTVFEGLIRDQDSGLAAKRHHGSSRDLPVTVGKLWARRGQRAGYRYPIRNKPEGAPP